MTAGRTTCWALIATAGWALLGSVGCDLQSLSGPFSASGDVLEALGGADSPAAQGQVLTADAGPDRTVASGATVVLYGKGTHTADCAAHLSYGWTQVATEAAKDRVRQRVILGQKLIFKAPLGPTTLTFCFGVQDAAGNAASDHCQVRVLSPGEKTSEPPPTTVITSGMTGWLDNAGNPYLQDLSADFLGAGVTSSTDVLEVISGLGVVPGIYGIIAVSTSELDLDADAGQSETADVSYRVLRP